MAHELGRVDLDSEVVLAVARHLDVLPVVVETGVQMNGPSNGPTSSFASSNYRSSTSSLVVFSLIVSERRTTNGGETVGTYRSDRGNCFPVRPQTGRGRSVND
jgi:hypothetical protein